MAVKYKHKKFRREHSKRSARTKDRVVKRYLKREAVWARQDIFWNEVARVRKLRQQRAA